MIQVGFKKGRLTVIEVLASKRSNSGKLNPVVMCRCECGNIKTYLLYNILYGKTLSCGCLQKELKSKRVTIHGLSGHPLFEVWNSMLDRCYKPKTTHFEHYGGRGIRVCWAWKQGFESFYKWAIQNGWKPTLQLERIKNNQNYTPKNCTFATRKEQCRNRRSNVVISYKGEKKCVVEWAEHFKIPSTVIYQRLKRKVPKNRLFEPVKKWTYLTISGKRMTITEWATEYGLSKETVAERYRKGVRGEKLFFKGNMRSYKPS